MSAHEQILAAASQNAEILSALAEVDYAPSALRQQEVYMKDLSREISQTDSQIKKLEIGLKSQRKEHEKYRDSTMRRFAYRVSGKKEDFAEKAEKGEREYVDALNNELQAKARRELQRSQWEEAERTKTDVELAAQKRTRLQKQLNSLYNSIFAGPTPDFPEEDARESEVKQATVVYDQRQQALKVETQAIRILSQADAVMLRALNEVASALQYSQYDIYGFGGSFADFSERSALSRAQMAVNQVQMLISQARRIQPAVKKISATSIASGNLVGDILFDNVFSDIAFHRKIEASGRELVDAAHELQAEITIAKEREKTARQELAEVARDLEISRAALQRVRQETFARVVEAGGIPEPRAAATPAADADADAAPPSYEDSAEPPSYPAE